MDTSTQISTVATCTLEKAHYSRLYEALMKEFSRSELRCFESQVSAFMHENYRVSLLEDAQAFALWWDFASIIFVEYVVVAKYLRHCGRGSRLLNGLKQFGKIIVLEVETNNRGLLGFYKANGFKINNVDYKAIPLSDFAADEYYLLSFHRELSSLEFEEFTRTINAPEYQF